MKKALYVELPSKVINDAKKLATKLDIPMNKLVELSLREVVSSAPQIKLIFDASPSKSRKS